MVKDCPFCEPEDKVIGSGCCFCDFTGRIRIAPGQFWETEEDFNSFYEARKKYFEEAQRNAIEFINKNKV